MQNYKKKFNMKAPKVKISHLLIIFCIFALLNFMEII